MQDLDTAAMLVFDSIVTLVIVVFAVRTVFKKRSRHIPSAAFRSVDVSRIIRKG